VAAAVMAWSPVILDQGRPNGWSQSRALPTPILRLGVPCEGTVRDPTRLAALATTTSAGLVLAGAMTGGAPPQRVLV
jgi:hypothetical protein